MVVFNLASSSSDVYREGGMRRKFLVGFCSSFRSSTKSCCMMTNAVSFRSMDIRRLHQRRRNVGRVAASQLQQKRVAAILPSENSGLFVYSESKPSRSYPPIGKETPISTANETPRMNCSIVFQVCSIRTRLNRTLPQKTLSAAAIRQLVLSST